MPDPAKVPDSIWLDQPPLVPEPLQGEQQADVVVVGGGVSGLTLALTLAERDASVLLLEAGRLAGGASGRNAGFLLAAPAEPYGEQIALWGRDGARAMLLVGRRSHERIRRLISEYGIECDYRARGSLRLARTEEEADDHRESLSAMRVDGFPLEEIALSQAVPAHATGRFAAAFVMREDGEMHPVRFLHGVARAALGRGARLHGNSPVEGARWHSGRWEVRTASGVARAETLVLAANADAPRLCPELAPIVGPRRGQMLSTAPVPHEVAPLPTYAHWGYQYWRQTEDGRLVIGGWRDLDPDGEASDRAVPGGAIQQAIEAGLAELVPEGVAIERRWAGIMAFVRDGRPLVGWLDAGHHLALCGGFTGHGMGMAAACTLELAELLAWRAAPGIATFDPGRYPELRRAADGVTALGAAAG